MKQDRLGYLKTKHFGPEIEVQELCVGQRVRFSKLGVARSPKSTARTGTVVGLPATSTVVVLLDGNKTATRLHRSYVELDGDNMIRRLNEMGLTASQWQTSLATTGPMGVQ